MRSRFAPLVLIAACGGGGEPAPLISGSVSGDYQGTPFTATNGFVAEIGGQLGIVIGDGDIGCGTVDDTEPPDGINAAISMATVAVGTYSNVNVLLHFNIDHYEAHGTNGATVTITASTPDAEAGSVAGSVDWSTTADGQTYSVTGTFEVISCL